MLNNRCQILLQLLQHQSKLLLILLGSCWLCMMVVGLLLVGWEVTSGLRLLSVAGKRGTTAGRGHDLKLLRRLLLVRLPSLVLHGLGSLLWCRLVILLHKKSLDLTKRIGRINTTGGLRGLLRILSALQLIRQHGQQVEVRLLPAMDLLPIGRRLILHLRRLKELLLSRVARLKSRGHLS